MTKWPHGHLLMLWGPRRETCKGGAESPQGTMTTTLLPGPARPYDDDNLQAPRPPAPHDDTPLKGGLRATRHDSSTTPLIKHIKNQFFIN